MSLEQRVKKAKELTVVELPNTPTATFGIWDSKDDFYRVIITRPIQPHQPTITINHRQIRLEKILVECTKTYKASQAFCYHNIICHHGMGALFEAFDKQGMEIEFCRDQVVARGRIGRDEWDRTKNSSHLAFIKTKQGSGEVWAVIRDKMKVVDHGDMRQRVNLMRGNELEEEIN